MAINKKLGIPVLLGSAFVLMISALNSESETENSLEKPLALDLLSQISIQAEVREGYQRELFMTDWSDFDEDNCDTRREVLIQESLAPTEIEENCKITSGLWISIYDNVEASDPTLFDIDHFVPLAEAWDSGANLWQEDQRKLFAEDLSDPDHLIAVSRQSNRNKGDRDPAEWLPILPETHCWYVTTWVTIKHRWQLGMDQAEYEAIERILNSC